MKKESKLISLGLLFAIGSVSHAGDALIDKYKENYIKQLTPVIEGALKTQYGVKLSQKEIESSAHDQAVKVTACQVAALDLYPKKYREMSVKTIAEGMPIPQSNSLLNNEIKSDIQNGNMTQQEFMGMMEKVIGSIKSCMTKG